MTGILGAHELEQVLAGVRCTGLEQVGIQTQRNIQFRTEAIAIIGIGPAESSYILKRIGRNLKDTFSN